MLLSEGKSMRIFPASFLIMGATQIISGHWIKGSVFLLFQIVVISNINLLLNATQGLITLGTVAQTRSGFDIVAGDNSIFMLVEGVVAFIFLFFSIFVYWLNIKDAQVCENYHVGSGIYCLHCLYYYADDHHRFGITNKLLGSSSYPT